jgi:hypothetical protein
VTRRPMKAGRPMNSSNGRPSMVGQALTCNPPGRSLLQPWRGLFQRELAVVPGARPSAPMSRPSGRRKDRPRRGQRTLRCCHFNAPEGLRKRLVPTATSPRSLRRLCRRNSRRWRWQDAVDPPHRPRASPARNRRSNSLKGLPRTLGTQGRRR